MTLTAELRALARAYRLRAMVADRPIDQSLLMTMSEEFERDAQIAERQERLAGRWRPPAASTEAEMPQSKAA